MVVQSIKLSKDKKEFTTKEYSAIKDVTQDTYLKKLMTLRLNKEYEKLHSKCKKTKSYRYFKLEKKNEEVHKQITLEKAVKDNELDILHLEALSINRLYDYLVENHDKIDEIVLSHSTGKDSMIASLIFFETMEILKHKNIEIYNKLDKIWITNFENTSNATAIEYKIAKSLPRVKILNPKKGLLNWLKEDKKYQPPTVLKRNCCSQYKEGQLTKHYDKNKRIVMITGVRCYESTKRANYTFNMDHDKRLRIHGADTLPNKWVNLAVNYDWTDIEVWLYILMNKIEFNPLYRLGFHRIGCLNCPMQQDYIDILTEYFFEESKARWDDLLEKDYEINNRWRVFKWTKEEYIDFGKWKSGTGYENYITSLKMTDKRVKELAKRKGCTGEVAKRFWDKHCEKCGKKLSPSQISMSEKLHRNKPHICKDCLCEGYGMTKEQYKNLQIELYNSDCKLF